MIADIERVKQMITDSVTLPDVEDNLEKIIASLDLCGRSKHLKQAP